MKTTSRVFRYSFITLLWLTFSTTFAQKSVNKGLTPQECGTLTPSKEAIEAAEKAILQLKQGLGDKGLPSLVTVPIKAHIIRLSDGTGGLSEATLNAAIATMNTIYQPINLQFYLCSGVHYIDNDDLYNCDINTDNSQLVLNNVNDAVNIYFAGVLTGDGSQLNGVSSFPSANPAENRILMNNVAVGNGETLSHEMGHYWNLYHTHEDKSGGYELVTRGAGANCTTAGDRVCDTPADPCCYFYNSSTCTYNGTTVDASGATYSPMINNLMSYYTNCRSQFTTGQQNRITDGYTYRLSLMQALGTYVFNCPAVAIAAPSNIVVGYGYCAVNISWTDNSANENGYIIERSTNATTGFVAVGTVAANVVSFADISPLSGVTAYYRVVAANSNAIPSAVTSLFIPNSLCYCVPGFTECNIGDAIINFALSAGSSTLINRASGCGANGYTDNSETTSATLIPGQTYTVTVTNQDEYPEGFTVWIDLNQDRIFASNEIMFRSAIHVRQAVQSGSFTLPASALSGQTRLRVRQSDDKAEVPSSPCNAYLYGETEDYTIVIPGPPSAIASKASGDWNNPSTWTGNQVPALSSEVTISPTHTVTINGITAMARKVKINGIISYLNNGKLQVGQ